MPGLWADEDVVSIAKVGICVVARSGTDHHHVIKEHHILKNHLDNITVIEEVIQNELSSTAIRKAVVKGHSAKYLTADSVLDYMLSNRLYSEESQKKNSDTVLAPLR